MGETTRSNALLLFAVTAWGASFVAARVVLTTLDPVTLAAVRFSIASLVFLPLLINRQLRGVGVRTTDIPAFLLLGQVGVSVYFWLQYAGVRLTSAAVSSLLVVGLAPIITAVLSRATLREPMGGGLMCSLLLGLVGVGVVATQGGLHGSVRSGFLLGSVCLVCDAFFFAVYSTQVRRLGARYPSVTITAAITLSGAAGLLLISTVAGDWRRLALLSPVQWAAVVYLALVCSIMAYFAYNHALSRIEAAKASAWLYLEPVVAAALGVTLLKETAGLRTLLGGLMIVASLYLIHSHRGDRRPAA
ncbi:MAG: DMT family transporter [Ignavibacteriales bacterium]